MDKGKYPRLKYKCPSSQHLYICPKSTGISCKTCIEAYGNDEEKKQIIENKKIK